MSLVLSGQYTNTSANPAAYSISGFQLPRLSDAGPGARSFNLGESELGMSANIDPWLRGAANISLHGDDTVSIKSFGLDVIATLCEQLRAQGVPGIHFYTMNQAGATSEIIRRLASA